MSLSLNLAERRRYRAVWADPSRKARTLESFSQTEANGGIDIAAAAERATRPDLKMHLERHAQDEVRHAELFRRRAAELYAQGVGTAHDEGLSDRAANLDTGTEGGFGDHGFLHGSRIDDVGELAYVAQLHIVEKEAERLFALHRDLTASTDPETSRIFGEILKDEKYHVSWTGTILDKYRKEGRAKEVKEALDDAKGERLWSAWKRLGVRSAGTFGRVTMWVFYYTLLLPFALVARSQRTQSDWQTPREGLDEAAALSQQF